MQEEIPAVSEFEPLPPVMREKLSAAIVRERLLRRTDEAFAEACKDVLMIWIHAQAMVASSDATLGRLREMRSDEGGQEHQTR